MGFLCRYAFKNKSKRFWAALGDAVGHAAFLVPRFLKPKLDLARIKKILVIRLDHLGDVAMTRPALQALFNHFPHAQIDLLVPAETAPLLQDSREVRKILTMEHSWFSKSSLKEQWREAQNILGHLKEQHYDLGIDFRGDLRNILLMAFAGIPERFGYGRTGGGFLLTYLGKYSRKEHQVELNRKLLRPLGIDEEPANEPFLYSQSRKLQFWESTGRLLPEGARPRIVIHPGAGYPSKRWPASKFKTLIERILAENLGPIILIGTETEKNLLSLDVRDPRLIDLRGKTRLEELPILLDACHVFIGNDSGPSHIAAAQGLPLILLFSGTNDALVWHPWAKSIALIRHEVPCSPCEARECPLIHHDCMEKISVEEVLAQLRVALNKAGTRFL